MHGEGVVVGVSRVASGELLGVVGNRVLVGRVNEQFHAALQNLSAYPRWVVGSCAIVVSLAVLWVLGKLLKWTVYVVVSLAAIAVIGSGVWWWMGRM